MGFTSVLASLLLGHLLADFPLQTNGIYKLKQEGLIGHIPHVLIHMIMSLVLLPGLIQRFSLLLLLGTGHFIIDVLKPYWGFERTSKAFIFDQGLHALFLLIIARQAKDLSPILPLYILVFLLFVAFVPGMLMYFSLRKKENPHTFSSTQSDNKWRHLFHVVYHIIGFFPLYLVMLRWMTLAI